MKITSAGPDSPIYKQGWRTASLPGRNPSSVSKQGARRPFRIVQVNDEPSVLEAFGILLRSWLPDITMLSVDNAPAALEEVSRTEPDLLITDDKMPGMSGEELCRRLIERKVAYPVIVNSPWEPTEQWVRELAGRGLKMSFLPLPFTIEGFRNALKDAGFEIPRD
jgi:DNA-binding NtrC family response regulator